MVVRRRPKFDNEMIRLHINAVLQGAAAPPFLVIFAAVGGSLVR